MQHRRVPCDDAKALNEFLNETDPRDGKGIRVPASYRVELNSLNESSNQRLV